MAYTLKIYFTGAGLFHFEGHDTASNPTSGYFFLANATKNIDYHNSLGSQRPGIHTPRLTVAARNVVPIGGSKLEPSQTIAGPGGQVSLVYDLCEEDVVVCPGQGTASGLTVCRGRNPQEHHTPSDPGADEAWYDWVPFLPALDARIDKIRQECLPPVEPSKRSPLVSRVKFETGVLTTAAVTRIAGRYVAFEYVTAALQQPASQLPWQSLADLTVLTIEGIEDHPSILECTSGKLGVGQEVPGSDEVVEIAITNLEATYAPPKTVLFDFLWLYELFDWKEAKPPLGELIIPRMMSASGAGFCASTGTCNPGSG